MRRELGAEVNFLGVTCTSMVTEPWEEEMSPKERINQDPRVQEPTSGDLLFIEDGYTWERQG